MIFALFQATDAALAGEGGEEGEPGEDAQCDDHAEVWFSDAERAVVVDEQGEDEIVGDEGTMQPTEAEGARKDDEHDVMEEAVTRQDGLEDVAVADERQRAVHYHDGSAQNWQVF